MPEVSLHDLKHLMNTLETIQAEHEQLELDNEWYASDSLGLIESSLEIIHSKLGITPNATDEEFDDE